MSLQVSKYDTVLYEYQNMKIRWRAVSPVVVAKRWADC